MKFGYKEIKEFAENHEDERVRIIYRKLCEARSKSAKWCEEVEKLKEENKQLRLGWCKESEKRQGEWHSESAKIPFINKDTITIRDTLCYYCHGAGQIEVRIVWDSKTPYSQQGWAVCRMCEGKGYL